MLEVTPTNVHCGKCARGKPLCLVHEAKISLMRDVFVGIVRANYEPTRLAAYGWFIDKTMLPEDNSIEPLDDSAAALRIAASVLYYRKYERSA
jgi:hypothetical protein